MNTDQVPSPAGGTEAASVPVAADAALSREELAYPDDKPKAEPQAPKPSPEVPSQEKPPLPATDDYRLTMPHGVELDQELLNSAVPALREAGISSEQASKLVPLVNQVQERFQKSQLDQFSTIRSTWAKEAKADPEMGGERWKETGRLAAVALGAGGAAAMTHEARQLLNESGLGNHPVMIRMFRRMGAEIERLQRLGGAGRRSHATREERSYPNDPSR